jgi:hypothetical protein
MNRGWPVKLRRWTMPMLKIAERWFERRAIADGVTWLYEPHVDPFLRCNVWHVRGRDRD